MKYITNVEINNFQSHKNTKIDFINGLNVIVGPSDQGKTAIIRAIKWVLYNEPLGDFFIRHGENEVSVIITFNTGEKVKRLRSKSKNIYVYICKNGSEEIYEGFGTNPPIDIVEKLNIKKINLDSKESKSINIGEQLEGPFLLSQKNSIKANAIGRLVGVHVVDKAVQNTIKDTRSLTIKNNSLKDDIDTLELKLSKYDYLKSLENKIVKLETIEEAINYKENSLSKLILIKKKYYNNIKEIKKYKEIIFKLSKIDTIMKDILDLDNKIHKVKRLNKLKIKLLETKELKSKNTYLLNNFKNLYYVENSINILEEKLNINKSLISKYNNYNMLTAEIKKIKSINFRLDNINDLNNIYLKIEYKSKKLNDLIVYSKNFNKINFNIKKGKTYINKFKFINEVNYLYNEISDKINKLNKLNLLVVKFKKINTEISKTTEIFNNEKLKHNQLLKKYKELLENIEKCPLCFNKISNDDMKKIINTLK
ncbi:AAA family ATPase [Clostridium sp. D2Q-14]|uniref:AAA family ATPase n=1 Tax=Anaeromonas gelatinilytica TaxID=2683194 RepID=UPI00193C65C9|nr:AAA family ATPase [Anaeromonas gelatinilytica]MBS4535987.1 AAA family ATPase [Anaeromonas gelatinilytica]